VRISDTVFCINAAMKDLVSSPAALKMEVHLQAHVTKCSCKWFKWFPALEPGGQHLTVVTCGKREDLQLILVLFVIINHHYK